MKRKRNLKSYESQATISVILAGLGAFGVMVALFCVLKGFDWQVFMLTYNSKGPRLILLGASLFVSLAAGVVGFCVGFNSAGQRRNKKSRLAWIGFFTNAALIAVSLMVAIFFVLTRNPISME